jgi:hypothetical protein
VVPTLVDATSASMECSAFMVRAATSDPYTFFDSAIENGISVDNLPPQTPSPFTGAYATGATHLHWGQSPDQDFATFRLYKGATSSFVPGPGNLISAQPDTGYNDAGPAGSWYKLSAVDLNGNESVFAVLGPNQTLAAPPVAALEFALHGVRPNPSLASRMNVEFSLPSSDPATIELIDVAGRRVVERSVGGLGPGRHVVDIAQGHSIPPGLYLVRLSQGSQQRMTRAIVL